MSGALAMDGGQPVRTRPFAPWPAFDEESIEAVTGVLRSGRLTYWSGPHGRVLEQRYAASLGRAHGIALANGTLALELGLRAFGIGPGDEVIVPARTFIATASAVVAVGAVPVVADIDTLTGALTAESVRVALTPRTRAVIPVHLGGWPVEMPQLLDLAAERGLVVLEDCAQAHGAVRDGVPVGAGQRLTGRSRACHAAAFSFCQDKIVSSGEGGLLVIDDDEAFERAWSYKDHGKALAVLAAPPQPPGCGSCFGWHVERFGSNWRMPETAAVLVERGLERLPEYVAGRRRNAARLAAGLAGVAGLAFPEPEVGVLPSYYRFYAFLQLDELAQGWTRDRVAAAIAAEGVPCSYGTCAEIYRETAFRYAGLAPARRLPGAAEAHERSLAFLVHPTLEEGDMDDTAEAVRRVLGKAVR